MQNISYFCSFVLVALLSVGTLSGQVPTDAKEVTSEWIQSAKVYRSDSIIWVTPDSLAIQSVQIPRFCASIKSLQWVNDPSEVTLIPEPESWTLSWKKSPAMSKSIVIHLDQTAFLPVELQPIKPLGDGSIFLHAFQARTVGEKLRFEPQPHKNTVGYWTVTTDSASWTFHATSSGRYSLGVLQGCGAGQGGSQMRVALIREGKVVSSLDFTAVETGHFQNFQWLHVGYVDVPAEGEYQCKLEPIKIAKAAALDVRTMELVKQAK